MPRCRRLFLASLVLHYLGCSFLKASAEGLPIVIVRSKISGEEIEITVKNYEGSDVIYVVEEGLPREFRIEYWDESKGIGHTLLYNKRDRDARDGFGMDVRFLKSGETANFSIKLSEFSSDDKVVENEWCKARESGYFYLRFVFDEHPSPLYGVVMSDGLITSFK